LKQFLYGICLMLFPYALIHIFPLMFKPEENSRPSIEWSSEHCASASMKTKYHWNYYLWRIEKKQKKKLTTFTTNLCRINPGER
jgi:hypothetical protein